MHARARSGAAASGTAQASPRAAVDSRKSRPAAARPDKARRRADGGGDASRAPAAASARRPPPRPTAPGPAGSHAAWRLFGLAVPVHDDPGKDDHATVCPALATAAAARLGCPPADAPSVGARLLADHPSSLRVVRKSFDARGRGCFSYVLDADAAAAAAAGATRRPRRKAGWVEAAPPPEDAAQLSWAHPPPPPLPPPPTHGPTRNPVIVVGAGPAGLFAALRLAHAGVPSILLERGAPVEQRGRDIGRLAARRILSPSSNYLFGEGGAGTWSDGKLTTRVGKNAEPVRRVLATLVALGAPAAILTSGKPHLGTDRLVRILQAMRAALVGAGVDVRFNTTAVAFQAEHGRVARVIVAPSSDPSATTSLRASAVVFAPGHSARDTWAAAASAGATVEPKPFAVGFRVEHPQSLIDAVRLGELASRVCRGKGPVPVADYRLACQVAAEAGAAAASAVEAAASDPPPPRGVYSFCMCPGGQIVNTSTTPDELCINGMSFSQRGSRWANAAVVVGVGPGDWDWGEGGRGGASILSSHPAFAGVRFQRAVERAAALAGGRGSLKAPAQRVVDFLAGTSASADLPPSSYRLGVTPADLGALYPPPIVAALREGLGRFESDLPGFASSPAGLLHGVETRTSAPVRFVRGEAGGAGWGESPGLAGFYPAGEGAGYAGGIVSAAVDGVRAAEGVLAALTGVEVGAW